jgi:hypothetical protein
MSLYLNKIKKREKMKKISLIAIGFFIVFNLYAEEKMENIDKLDVLDKQSKEFFNAITGLEKNYLEEQVNAIKNKKEEQLNPNQSINPSSPQIIKEEVKISQEDYEKNVFTHQNEMARLTTDFTRTKKLKDLKIKSMYSFNGKDYVVLELTEDNKASTKALTELSANIEGRYIEGDNILGHKIMDINTRTKSIELYKKLDEEYGYTIYLSNYGISVSDLKKIPKEEVEKKTNEKKTKAEIKAEVKSEVKEAFPIKKAFEQVKDVEVKSPVVENKANECLYEVNKNNLNVRNKADLDARILRILRINDKFSIKQKNDDWVQIDTIYKKVSGDVMDVSNENNWVNIIDNSVNLPNENCK